MRAMSLKKGTQALSVFITIAPAQNNATSVQYAALPLKTDLPFTKDASAIEYSPDRPLLTLVTAEPVDKTLDFYRKELGARGWALWSEKTNGKQPAGGPSGVVHERGGYAHYVNDKEPTVALVLTLQKAEAGKYKVELKEWPVGILATLHKAYLNSDNSASALVDVSKLPRLEGAKEEADRTVIGPGGLFRRGTARRHDRRAKEAVGRRRLEAIRGPAGRSPLDLIGLQKRRARTVGVFYYSSGKKRKTSEVTTVYYSPTRLDFALAFPDDAADIVFDENRPYLSLTTAGSVDATLDFYRKELGAIGLFAVVRG